MFHHYNQGNAAESNPRVIATELDASDLSQKDSMVAIWWTQTICANIPALLPTTTGAMFHGVLY
jgi:hypothetical protein